MGHGKRCVGLVWVLACIRKGRQLAYSRHRRYRPFPQSAVATPASLSASLSGFSGMQKSTLTLLLRFMGAQATRSLSLNRRGPPVALVAADVTESSSKIEAAR